MLVPCSSQVPSWNESRDLHVFERLHDDAINLVRWRRRIPSRVSAELFRWAAQSSASHEALVSKLPHDLSAATEGLSTAAARWVAGDMNLLLNHFTKLAETCRLRVWFGVVRGDQCRKFHVDYYRYRLLTTYIGPGTEWVPDHGVRREALAQAAESPLDANRAIVRDLSAVQRAAAGDVLVMKGERYSRGRGAVHRSPTLEGTGRIRVVFVATALG